MEWLGAVVAGSEADALLAEKIREVMRVNAVDDEADAAVMVTDIFGTEDAETGNL